MNSRARLFAATLGVLAAVLSAAGSSVPAWAQTTYTWNRTNAADWTTSTNWTPTRSSPNASDILVVNGSTTPSPTIRLVPTQTIGRLRIINNANVTFTTSANANLTITGGAAPNFEVAAGSAVTLSGSSFIRINIGSGATASIAGQITLTGGTHQLLGSSSNSIVFASGGGLTTATGYTSNAFGTTGTANVVVFQSGSTYTHNAGADVFGLAAPSSKVTFQTGSTAIYRGTTGYVASGRTFANLTAQNNVALSGSGNSSFQFQNLLVESGSSFTHTGSGGATVTVTGNISSAGTGNISITAGSGGIQLNSGAVQTIGGGGGTGTITFGSNATIGSTTTVAVARTLAFSAGAMNVQGTFRIDQGGSATGSNFTYGAAATLVFNNTSGSFGVSSSSPFWPTSNGPTKVTVQGAGGITMNAGATRTVSGTFTVSGPVTGANLLTLSGTTQVSTGATFASSPIYSGTATLVYNSAFTVGNEWGSGTVVGSGVPRNVTVQAGAGSVSLPNTDRTVPGDLLITSGTLALNATSGNLLVGGNWTNNATFTQNGRVVTFNGAANQTITRTGGETFSILAVDKTAGNLVLGANVTVSGASGDVLRLLNTGGIDLNNLTLTLSGAGGNLLAGGTTATARTITGTGTLAFTAAKTVTSASSRTLTLDTNVRTTLSAGVDFGASLTTVRGVVELLSGGSVTANAPIYASGSILRYNSGGTRNRSAEWSATSGAGYPFNVEVMGATTLDLGSGGTATARQLAGNLTIVSGATLTANNGANAMTAALTALGDVTVSGTLTLSTLSGGDLGLAGNLVVNGTINTNNRGLLFQGAATQTITRTGGLSFGFVRLNKSAGSAQLLVDLTLSTSTTAISFDGTVDVLDLNGRTLTLSGTTGGVDASGSLRGSATSRIVWNGTGAAGTVRFTSGAQTLDQLTLNRTSSGSLTLGSPLTINGALTLTAGSLVTGANTLTLAPSGTVSRTSGFVDGNFAKRAATGAASLTFEVGSAGNYAPVSVQFGSVTVAGDLTASTTAGDHPSLAGSGIIANKSVNRRWALSGSSITFNTYTSTFTFPAGEVDAGATPANFEARRFVSPNWFTTTVGTNTATSTQATGVTAFGEFAVGEIVSWTITSSAGANGSVSPLGAVSVSDGRNRTFNIVPNVGHHVQDVLVDGASVGAVTSYTFTNVKANHTLAASFAINHYTLTFTIEGEGSFSYSPVQADYVYGDFITATATPARGWEFLEWNGNGGDWYTPANPTGITMDQNHNVLVRFQRSPVQYVRSTFTSAYAPLSAGSGATLLMSSFADDSTRSIPMPFPFTYSGLHYTPSNFLAVNVNGFAFLSRSTVAASLGAQANNLNLFSSTSPNLTMAPWYDDLSAAAVGTNPNGSILYRTQGSAGSRTLTVQWTDVSSFSNPNAGQPRRINFQLVLFEGTDVIEFRYGPISGTTSTVESASIGLEDSLGGNGGYLDGVTGSRVTYNGMNTTNKWPTRHLRFTPGPAAPLVAFTYDVGPGSPFYPNLSEAVADLNQRGISGPITLRLTQSVSDTTSAGGNNIFPILVSRVTGASATNTITIQPSSGTATIRARGTESGTCGNQSISNVISTSNEPILGLVGTDYVTIKNLVLEGGPTVDRGLLLVQTSTSDGAQHNRISDVSVQLTRANTSGVGIQQIVSTTPTGVSGTNSDNLYDNIVVTNAYAGISLAGNSTIPDEDCEVGITAGGSTVIGGATAGDIGNGTTQTFGIRATNQKGVRIFGADVRNITGTGSGSVDGILVDNLSTASFNGGNCLVYNNRVHGLDNTSLSAGRVAGIRVNLSSNAANVARVYDNFIYGLNSASTSTVSRRIAGIMVQDAGGGLGVHEVDFNSVRIAPQSLSSPNTCFEVGTSSGPVVRVRNNIFANFVGTQSGSGKHYCWVAAGSAIGASGSVSDRNVLHINNLSNGFTGLVNSTDRATLVDWQSATGQDANSAAANPQFVSDIDLHISTTRPTPVEGRASFFGGAITWVGSDIDGDVRSGITPDVGADEGSFNLLVANDIGASAIIAPTDGSMVIAGSSFTPQASFENSGTTTQTNVPVRFRVLGPQPSSSIVYDQTSTIASIAAGSTQAVTFPNGSIAQSGFYTTQATALLSNDQNHGNDQLAATFENAGPLSGAYSVGASQPAPFNSITQAIARLNTVGVSAAVTLKLTDFSYGAGETFPININAYSGASAANRVTLRPGVGVTSTITGATNRALFVLNGADYVTIDGSNTVGGTTRDLTLTNNDPSAASAVIWGQTTSGNPATNDVLTNLVINGSGGSQTLFGIGFGASTIGLISGGTGNNNNTIDNCLVRRVQYGIYSAGFSINSKTTGTTITRNEINAAAPNNVTKAGIIVRFENNVTISQNKIAEIVTAESVSPVGIVLGMTNIASDTFIGDEVTNATVTRNQIDHVESTNPDGLSAIGISLAPATSGITTIANNMIGRITSPALDPDLVSGILLGGGAGSTTRVYFNSVYLTGARGNASSPSFDLAIGGTNPTVDVRDNIFANTQTTTGPGASYSIGLAYETTYSNLTSNYNVFYVATAPIAMTGGLTNNEVGDIANLADWRSLTNKDGNTLASNPVFESATNLHIRQAGSPAANAGSPLAAVTMDYDGEPGRRATTPDIGADEFATQLLNVTVVGGGSVTKNPNAPNYITGDVVQLTAVPTTGNHFVSWSGDQTGSQNPVSITMSADKNITATFAINAYTLTLTAVGTGSFVKSPNQATYSHGANVSVTANPGAGYHFGSWTGDATGSTNPLTVAMTADKAITGTFLVNTYALTVNTVGNGTVAKSPDQPSYNHGTSVTLTATPAAGYHFTGWSGGATGTQNPIAVTMDAAKTVTATFVQNTYTLSVAVTGSGTVAKNPNQASYAESTQVQLTPTPAAGYGFTAWTGDASGTANPLTVTMNANKSIGATFTLQRYPVDVVATGHGTIARSPDQADYAYGSSVQITATPAPGHDFVEWNGDATGTQNPLTVPVDGPKNIVAVFTQTVNVLVVGNGTVTKDPDQTGYAPGAGVGLTATPSPGHAFVDWTGDASGSTNPLDVTVDGDETITARFTMALDVSVVGNGSVAKSPDQPNYVPGATVQLTATPAAGYFFSSWSGDATGSTNPINVTMSANRSVTATFLINGYPLNLSVIGAGVVGKSPNQPTYNDGTVVQLTATPDAGHSFVGWSGDATGSTSPISVTMNAVKNITATFTTRLVVTTVGNGTVAKSPDQISYAPGANVTLTANPAANNHLVSWSGDASGSANPLGVTMSGNRNITATFAIDTHPLAVSTTGSGSVARSPDQPSYDHGAIVTLTATPATGWHFVSWSGNASGSTNPLPVTMDAAKSITANFAINTYTLSLTSGGNGTLAASPVRATYDHGTNVSITATPSAGYHFTQWTGDASGSTNPLSVTMNANMSITGSFAINNYPLTVNITGSGSVAQTPNQAGYDHGTTVQLTATPEVGYHLVSWSGAASGSTNPLSVLMDQPKTITATFAINTYTLGITTVGNGSVLKSPDQATYDHGSVVMLSPSPGQAQHFVGWSGDASGTTDPLPVTMDGNKNITATFAINTYTLDVVTSGNGTVAKSPNQASYDQGTVVSVTATPAEGHHFVGWSGDASGTANPLTLTLDGNRSITATFAINTYSLDVNSVGNGTVTRNPDRALYDHGTSVTLTAVPAAGHSLVGWSGDASGATNPLVITTDANKAITATFAINTYPLTVNVTGSGSVARSPDQPVYDHGTSVTLTATAAVGYHFVNWSGDASSTLDAVSVTMNGPKTVTATFAINTYALNVSVSGSGSVAKSPDQPAYNHGTSVTLTATPSAGWHFTGWSGDLTGAANPAAITMDAVKNVTATFAIDLMTLDVSTVGSGSVTKSPDQATYNYGSVVTLTAVPGAGYHFVDWSGDETGTTNPLSVTMSTNKSVIATFEINRYTLDVGISGGGNVGKSPNLPLYDHGTTVRITAVATIGYTFQGWTGDASGSANTINVLMDGNKSMTANFVVSNHTLNITAVGGSVAKSPDQATYPHGSEVQLTATPNPGYHFRDWIGDASGTSPTITVEMDQDRDITARFQTNTFTVNVVTVGGNASQIEKFPNQAQYDPGSKVDILCTPATGYQFRYWTLNTRDTVGSNPASFTTDSSLTITCHLVPGGPPTLTTVVNGNGALARDPDQPSYTVGSIVNLTATPQPGWRFVSWAGQWNAITNPLQVLMDRDKTITATFLPNTVTLNVSVIGLGAVARNPNQATYELGNQVQLTATPSAGYHFGGWSGDTTTTQNPFTLTMNGNKSLTATFGFVLNLTAVGTGTITRSPNRPVYAPGDTVTLTASAGNRFHFAGFTGDSITLSSAIRVVMNSDHAFTATFAPNRYTLTVSADGQGIVVKTPDQPDYAEGDRVELRAEPQPGQRFVGWSETSTDPMVQRGPGGSPGCPSCVNGTQNPIQVDMMSDRTIVATFESTVGLLAISTEGSGVVCEQGAATSEVVELLAIARPGSRFAGWMGERTGLENPLVVSSALSGTLVATFVETSAVTPPADVPQAATDRGPDLPTELALVRIAPNPTRGAVKMDFTVPRETRVRLVVIDAQGREIASLADAAYRPGRYSVSWDGRTARGDAPPGVYFARLIASDRALVRRFVIAR
jgi:uncharacterized repeat protein (TIGR02543 family)